MTNASEVPPEQIVLQQEGDDATSPHDALFYKTFSNPEHAAAELKHILDPALVARLEWDTLRLLSIKFVDAKLKGKYADVLYSVRIQGRETLIYFLLEHKSESEPWTPLQLLEYKARIWRNYIEDPVNKGRTRLPVIIAVLLHHSERGWTGHRRELASIWHYAKSPARSACHRSGYRVFEDSRQGTGRGGSYGVATSSREFNR